MNKLHPLVQSDQKVACHKQQVKLIFQTIQCTIIKSEIVLGVIHGYSTLIAIQFYPERDISTYIA